MQTWKSGLLKNAHRPIFHAHRCCKITLLLSQTNLEDNFDTTNLLFFRGNDPSPASFNHPLTGTCIWFLHGRCLNIWILTPSLCRCDRKSWKWWSIGRHWPTLLPELPIFGEEWRKHQIPNISSSEIFWFDTWSSNDPSFDSGWLYTYVICIICMIVYCTSSNHIQLGWTSVVANQDISERLPPHLAIEEHPTFWQQIRTRCTHGFWVEDVTSAVGPFGARAGFVSRILNIGIFQECLSRNRTLQREEVQSPRSLAWMSCGGSQDESHTIFPHCWNLRISASHFDCVKSKIIFPRFHQGTVLALEVLVKLTLTSNSPILILRFSSEFGCPIPMGVTHWSWRLMARK